MKITTDVNDIFPQRVNTSSFKRNIKITSQVSANRANISNTLRHSISSMASRERSLNDALSIAHMSQSIIQKAMNISSKLRSIALNAMSTGRVNIPELNQALTEIDFSMREYGEKIVAPAQSFRSRPVVIEDTPNINKDLVRLMDLANNLQEKETLWKHQNHL